MESTKSSLFGKSHSPPVIDPRLLSLESGLPQAEGPFSAALIAAGPVWKRGSKQSEFQKHLADETDVAGHISQHTKLDSLQDSVATNDVSTTSIDRFAPAVFYPSATKTDALTHNEFDAALLELETVSDTEIVDANAISYLSLWVAKNNSIQPPVKQLKALETLTEVPAPILLAWLTRHGRGLLAEQKPALNRAKMPSVPEGLYFVRCLKSGFRYRPRKGDSYEPKVFECTNQCGQLFCRKGDWGRHERLNFEEWPCFQCAKVLSRCEHLRAHFKDAHAGKKDIARFQKRDFLMARQRPCGFCGSTLTNWSAWLAHVASHFEEHREGRGRTMSYWTEYRSFDEAEMETVVTAPKEAVPATKTALETQSDHITRHSALCRVEYQESEEGIKSASFGTVTKMPDLWQKTSGRDGDQHGQIGNHYNDSEPQFTSGPKSSTKVQTGNRNGGAPSFENDIFYSPTYGNAGRHMPERQASDEPASSSYSGSRHSVAGGRHPNADRHKAKFPAMDSYTPLSLGHRDTSDEDHDYTISQSTRASALSKIQPTAHETTRLHSARHSRPPTPPMPASQAKRGVESEDPYDELEAAFLFVSLY